MLVFPFQGGRSDPDHHRDSGHSGQHSGQFHPVQKRDEKRFQSGESMRCLGRGGGLVDRAADSGPCDPSLIPLGDKKGKKTKKRPRLAH